MSAEDAEITRQATQLVAKLTAAKLTIATAESLTAGLVAATIAQVPGASAVLRGGLITYATELKHTLAGVDAALLAARGPVDPDVAAQMATGAARSCEAAVGVACTGVAGPDPQDGKPVGMVYTAVALLPQETQAAWREPIVQVDQHHFSGDRAVIRAATVQQLLTQIAAVLFPPPHHNR